MIPYTALTQGLALLQDRMPFSRQVKLKCPFARFGPWSCCKPRKPYSFSSLSPKLKQNMQHCSGCTWFCLHNMLLLAWQHLAMYCSTFFHSCMQKSGAAVCTIFTACTALIQGYCLVQGFGVCLHSPFARLLPLFKATALCKAIHIMPFHIFETVSTWQLILRPWWHQPACKQARAPPPAAYGKP